MHLKTYIVVSEHDVNVGNGLEESILEELAQEGRRKIDHECLVALVRVLGNSHDRLRAHGKKVSLYRQKINK